MVNLTLHEPSIRFEETGYAGVITLNRPDKLNALCVSMMQQVQQQLQIWRTMPHVHFVIVKSNCDRSFCAGGDLRVVHQAMQRLDYDYLEELFRSEYALNHQIKNFGKPYVSLVDGIVMGGGVGLSVHGSHRVMTENTLFSMPETNIGYFPDVGATKFMNDSPGFFGLYAGMTGNHFRSSDAYVLGYGTHYVRASSLSEIESLLLSMKSPTVQEINKLLAPFEVEVVDAPLLRYANEVNDLFNKDSVLDIFAALRSSKSTFALETLEVLYQRSPTSVAVTFEQLRRGRSLKTFEEIMQLEFDMSQNFVRGFDFQEGIRAAIIDKDRKPHFNPVSIHELRMDEINDWFSPHPVPLDVDWVPRKKATHSSAQ